MDSNRIEEIRARLTGRPLAQPNFQASNFQSQPNFQQNFQLQQPVIPTTQPRQDELLFLCPICGSGPRNTTRDDRSTTTCVNGHIWHKCKVHGTNVIGRPDYNNPGCDCMTIGVMPCPICGESPINTSLNSNILTCSNGHMRHKCINGQYIMGYPSSSCGCGIQQSNLPNPSQFNIQYKRHPIQTNYATSNNQSGLIQSSSHPLTQPFMDPNQSCGRGTCHNCH